MKAWNQGAELSITAKTVRILVVTGTILLIGGILCIGYKQAWILESIGAVSLLVIATSSFWAANTYAKNSRKPGTTRRKTNSSAKKTEPKT